MIEDFTKYITQIIELTFSFTPVVNVVELPNRTFQITLDGNPKERQEMMGKEAHTFQSLKMLLRVFARKHGVYSYLYIKSQLEPNETNK